MYIFDVIYKLPLSLVELQLEIKIICIWICLVILKNEPFSQRSVLIQFELTTTAILEFFKRKWNKTI
jgi:hypothetical protein